jgi:hypothetical protein
MKHLMTAFALVTVTSQPLYASPRSLPVQYDEPAAAQRDEGTGLLRENSITSTGATVPHPGVSQSNGPTPLDRSIERQNDKIQSSICKGC